MELARQTQPALVITSRSNNKMFTHLKRLIELEGIGHSSVLSVELPAIDSLEGIGQYDDPSLSFIMESFNSRDLCEQKFRKQGMVMIVLM